MKAKETIKYFSSIGKYYTKDVDKYAKELIKKNEDVEDFKKYILDYSFLHRIYFRVKLHGKSLKEQLKIIEEHFDYFNDWWHIDQLCQMLIRPIDIALTVQKAKKYIKSKKTFARRWGYVILFTGAQTKKEYLDDIFAMFRDDDEYYVQMSEAWLICDLCVFHPKETLDFIKKSKLNYNILGKAIQKICDSFRISDEDKEIAKSLRKIVKDNNLNSARNIK